MTIMNQLNWLLDTVRTTQQPESWLLDTIRTIVTGNYSIEGKHKWTVFIPNESQKKVLTCTSLSTGERVYQTEITDPSISDVEMVLDHVITAYRHAGQFYSQTRLYSKTLGEWSCHMIITVPL